jgi:hypothetical protein
MQEKVEDAVQARIEVDLRLTAPHEPVVQDGAAAEMGTNQVAVETLVEGVTGVVGEVLETLQPGGGTAAAVFEGGLGEIVEAVVEPVDTELGSEDGGVLQGFVEEGSAELGAL